MPPSGSQRQRRKLLPVPYYLVTFTVPAQLRQVIRSHQKDLYPLLLRESAAALREVARDHKDLGAEIGLLAVLQTWTRDLRYHPHVHCVVPAGGLSPDRLRWVSPKREGYFLPQAVLALRLRTRLKAALQQAHPQTASSKSRAPPGPSTWVADVQPVGTGEPALKYLAAYVYRTAFSAERIVRRRGRGITFTYRDSKSRNAQPDCLSPERFLHRFLQHVLPRGLQRVRYFGFLSAAAKARWQRVLALLDWHPPRFLPAPSPVPMSRAAKNPWPSSAALPRPPPIHR